MTIHDLPRHTLATYHDQCEQDHWDRRRAGDTDSSPVEDGEGRLILIAAQMEANAAVRLAAVRGIANRSRREKTR